jgi:hypothetical protein
VRKRYPLWQYPIIFLFLLRLLIQIRFKVKALINSRKDLGIIPKDHKPTFQDLMSFGHWVAGEQMIEWWYKSTGGI